MRHLNEKLICAMWESSFNDGSRPSLVIGHSHEPRFQPAFPTGMFGDDAKHLADYYYNTGSVGRFENLLWGLEIRDGKATLISWHRPGGVGTPERHEYSNKQPSLGLMAVLYPSTSAIPVPT